MSLFYTLLIKYWKSQGMILLKILYVFGKAPRYQIFWRENYALTIKEGHVGFDEYDPNSHDQIFSMEDDVISQNNLTVCASRETLQVGTCTTNRELIKTFEMISKGEYAKFIVVGGKVLSVGEYNSETEMYNVLVSDPEKVRHDDFFFRVENVEE